MSNNSTEKIVIALDAMGGDNAPISVIEGAVLALKKVPDLFFKIYGVEDIVLPIIKKNQELKGKYEFIHCKDYIKNEDKPSDALRYGKESSMRRAINAVANNEAGAVVSAGNTGALMAMSKIVFKTINGIERPAITTYVPTKKDPCVLLDLGANSECSEKMLMEFAIMGKSFSKALLNVENPKVGLLNIGSEALKGNDLVQKTSEILQQNKNINYIGFAEGDDIFEGNFDVIVADGFTGNIALKVLEGTARFIKYKIKYAFLSNLIGKISLFILLIFGYFNIKKLMKDIDPRRYNGAIFAGLNGISVKSHGGADKLSFSNAIIIAKKLVEGDVNTKIKQELDILLK